MGLRKQESTDFWTTLYTENITPKFFLSVFFPLRHCLGMHRISGWPDIWPVNPAFFKDPVSSRIPDLIVRLSGRILQIAGYLANLFAVTSVADPDDFLPDPDQTFENVRIRILT
jgi:hypothetical protein